MSDGSFDLLGRRRFLPLFVTQFLGAANDNLFRNAAALLIVYRIGASAGPSAPVFATIGTGLFVLPYFLFSATAGELADRYEKSRLMRWVKLAEIGAAAVGAAGLFLANVWMLLGALFLLGTQATFFAPLKYAILPEHLESRDLVGANALIEGGTFLAILLGTILGGILVLAENGVTLVSALMLVTAAAGFAASLAVPLARPGNPRLRISANPLAGILPVIRTIRRSRAVFLSVLGISWFWAMGATFVTELPAYAKTVLNADENVVTVLLATFSIGIAVGSVLCNKLLKGEISARHVPFAALGMAVFSLDLFFSSRYQRAFAGLPLGLADFIRGPGASRIVIDLLMLATFGGIYSVPLYAILQSRSEESERARAIAANNILNAAFMAAASGIAALLLYVGMDILHLFLVLAVLNTFTALYICRLLPDELLRGVLATVLRFLYGVEVRGLENLKAAGDRVVVVANHVSFLDPLLVAVFIPRRLVFAINTFIARLWWVRPFLGLVEAFPLDPTSPMSVRALARRTEEGSVSVIFPEGRLTRTGALMKVYEGPGLIADRANAAILPIRIDGAQYTPFTRLKGKVRVRWFPKITLTILPPRHFEVPGNLVGRARRQRAGIALYDLMSAMVFETGNRNRTLYEAFLDARHIHGGKAPILEDTERKPITYDRVASLSLMLGRLLARDTRIGECVGVLLPNVNATVAVFLGLQAIGRVPAMLNFTAGAANVAAACRAACVNRVVTSRRFVEQARLDKIIAGLAGQVEILWLEDMQARLSLRDKLYGALACHVAVRIHRRNRIDTDSSAAVLFTSGSEGTPKAVALSHANILANCLQLGARIDYNASDAVFNALPLFHAFGLTGGLLLPILSGVKIILYPSPLHFRIVPEFVYDANATIFFGTNTFLAGYVRQANAYDFYSVRYVFAGAEKVEETTRQAFAEKFGLRILEGYGVTETAPAIACNTPMHYRAGTVGRLLPGVEHRIEPVPGISEGGRLFVRGPNVMLGYLHAERPGVLDRVKDGWFDTGDIVTVDAEGYLRIVGRVKRFAKVAGEMISLAKVESEVAALWPQYQHAVIVVADERKGEQLVLVTNAPEISHETLSGEFRRRGLSELAVPRVVVCVDRLPLLGTGKIDYPAVRKMIAKE